MPAKGMPIARSSARIRGGALSRLPPRPALQEPAEVGARRRAAGGEARLHGTPRAGLRRLPSYPDAPATSAVLVLGLARGQAPEAGSTGSGRGPVPAAARQPRPSARQARSRGGGKRRSRGLGDGRSREGRGPGSLGRGSAAGVASTWGNSGRRTREPGHGNPGGGGNRAHGPQGHLGRAKSPRRAASSPGTRASFGLLIG